MKHNDVSWGVWCLEINIFIIHSSYIILISFILNITWHGSFRPWVLLRFPRSWLSLHGVLERQRCLGRCPWWQQPCQCHRKLQWHQCHRKLQWHQVHRSNPMQCLRSEFHSQVIHRDMNFGDEMVKHWVPKCWLRRFLVVPARRFWLETIRESLEAITSSTTVAYNCVRCIKSILKQSQGLPVIPLLGLHLSIFTAVEAEWLVWIDRWFMVTVNPLTHLNHITLLNLDGSW